MQDTKRPSESNGGGGSRTSKSASDGAGELGLVEGSDRGALRMNQLFFVTLSFWNGGCAGFVSGELEVGTLEGWAVACTREGTGVVGLRDLYHSAVVVRC